MLRHLASYWAKMAAFPQNIEKIQSEVKNDKGWYSWKSSMVPGWHFIDRSALGLRHSLLAADAHAHSDVYFNGYMDAHIHAHSDRHVYPHANADKDQDADASANAHTTPANAHASFHQGINADVPAI